MITHTTTRQLNPVIVDPGNGGSTELYIPVLSYRLEQVGTLPMTETAITWLQQVRQILDECWKRGIPRKQQTNQACSTHHDLNATIEAAPMAFSGYASLKGNSISQGSFEITRGPNEWLRIKVWPRQEDGFERGLGSRGIVLETGPKMKVSHFAAQDAEPALHVIRAVLCATDVLLRACAREKF